MTAKEKAIADDCCKESYDAEIELFMFYKRKFDDYKKFRSDSALVYARRMQEVAQRAKMTDEMLLADIELLYITILRGNLFAAKQMIDEMPPICEYPPQLRQYAARTMLEYNMRINVIASDYKGNMLDNICKSKPDSVWQKYKPYIAPDSWLYDYYEALFSSDDMRQRLATRLESVTQPSAQAAMLCLAMAKHCMEQGLDDEMCHWLIMSAINDIMSTNFESSSLTMLLYTQYVDKEQPRAANYAIACMKMAEAYGDALRSFDIVKTNSIITGNYVKMQEQIAKRSFMLSAIMVLLMLLTGTLVYILIKKARRKGIALNRTIDDNNRLHAALTEAAENKEQMLNANAYRNAVTLDTFELVSYYVNEVQKFDKMVANWIVAKQTNKAHKALQAGCSEHFLPRFYASFDKWFLSVRPDFIDRFNRLMRQECKIVPPSKGGLTPELRIYALVSLGITDSMSIAEFLHYSPQTIYNYRLRVRREACIPEKNFAATVAAMYAQEQDILKDDSK